MPNTQKNVASVSSKIVAELSDQVGITPAQAQKILRILHFDRLVLHVEAAEHVGANDRTAKALQLKRADAASFRRNVAVEKIRLSNLRLGLNTGVSGISVIA